MSEQRPNTYKKKRINRVHPIAEILCIVLFALVGCEPSMETVEHTTNQSKLAKIAIEAKKWDVRRAAVEKLSDQVMLAKVAEEAKWLDIRVTAIGKMTDQTVLRQWAEKDP